MNAVCWLLGHAWRRVSVAEELAKRASQYRALEPLLNTIRRTCTRCGLEA